MSIVVFSNFHCGSVYLSPVNVFFNHDVFIFNRKMNCTDPHEKSIKRTMLSVFSVIGCFPHVSHFQMHAPHELWIKPELKDNDTKCCATAEPDLNQVGFI